MNIDMGGAFTTLGDKRVTTNDFYNGTVNSESTNHLKCGQGASEVSRTSSRFPQIFAMLP